MPQVLEPATSSRAKCRACGRAICKGDLRLGEALPNPYGEGEATYWFHLRCAACMRPEPLLAALAAAQNEVAEAEWLRRVARDGVAHPRLTRLQSIERAPSGRARCRQCHELIEKGKWRLALSVFEEGRFSAIGNIHLECAAAYFDTDRVADRVHHFGAELSKEEASEVDAILASQSAPSAPPEPRAEPKLAKTAEPSSEEDASRRDAG